MKILVTGGAGYIGSHAVYELISKGYDVIVVDDLSTGSKKNIHSKVVFYQVDLKNEEKLDEVFAKEKDIIAVMHFAGSIIVSESVKKPIEYFENNVCSVQVLLKVMNKYNVKFLVFSSTAAVYGNPINIPIEENDLKEPINPYGKSKLAAELLIESWANAYKSNYVIFRYFNVAGAHENSKIGIRSNSLTHLVPTIVNTALNHDSIVMNIFGNDYNTKDGTCIRDFIHVVDLVQAHILGLEWSIKNNKSNIFNLGSSFGYSVLEVYNKAKQILGIDIKTKINNRRKGDPTILLASTKKVENILGWKSKKNLEEIIKSEYNFRKK